MSVFTQKEIEYLRSGLLGRLATVGRDGTPHVAPVGMFSYNAELDTIDIRGSAEAVEEPEAVIRIYPERIVAWGIDTGGSGWNSRSVG